MSCTFAQARSDMLKMITEAWKTANPTLPLFYDDRPESKPKDGTAWARVTVSHNAGDQDALAGPLGNRLFKRDGILVVQIFTPTGKGLSLADELAKVAADAYEGKSSPNGVWFRKVRMKEIGPDGSWYQVNVLAEFLYDEAK